MTHKCSGNPTNAVGGSHQRSWWIVQTHPTRAYQHGSESHQRSWWDYRILTWELHVMAFSNYRLACSFLSAGRLLSRRQRLASSASAIVAQLLAAIETHWSCP